MGSTEDADMLALIAAAPELATPDDTEIFLDAMSISELASMWGTLQRLSRRDKTGAAWSAFPYFDHLPHKRPDRAFDLALEVLRSEPDKPTVMQLNDKFMLSLLYAHGAAVIGRIEAEAEHNARLRWLLGGIRFGPDEPFKSRIEAIANTKAYRRDERARRTPKHPLDCEAMSVPELARAWVEQYSKSERDRDDNFFAMMDYERDLREEYPDKAIDLTVEILKNETNPVMLSLLAAGPLEDVISMETIDRIEREASANKRFRDLLGGVWYYRAPDELKACLDALVGQHRW
ncbi:DUF6869 domain-containing protein [Bradyrhizobium sp. 170]|uniref:DUF6869 domain-containing protein n=1 Tax=Bradyrhizobium sp. 170 TaxID=2782641 RepID=UPI001FFF76A5|nr:hypothetical protein [Bradyrhizobium sp. 170]UPK05022.1 hypothetical protein IVB05_04650 [Bradyrhizobium sp. 170]